MNLTKILPWSLLYFSLGIAIVSTLCILEMFYGSGLTHPLWDRYYDWMPLLKDIAIVSSVGGVVQVLCTVKLPDIQTNFNLSRRMIMETDKKTYGRLAKLESLRAILARKIDRSYLRNNITDFLTLEDRYEKVMRSINTTRQKLHGENQLTRSR